MVSIAGIRTTMVAYPHVLGRDDPDAIGHVG